ncbi:T9SS type A sorting domain-containing protein [Adhaeribacter soli]|nr:T9SS type A sorting domain-containing protein [Adhaeribacter soli]
MLAFLLSTHQVQAQAQPNPMYFQTGGTGNNTFPFNTTTVKRTQHIYLPGDLPGASSGLITRIYFRSVVAATGVYSDFVLRLGQTTGTTFPGAGGLDFFTNLTPVLTNASYTLTAPAVDGWVPIDLPTPFLYDAAQTLIVEVEMSNKITGGFGLRTSSTTPAPNHKRLTSTSLSANTGSASTVWSDFGIDVAPAMPCTTPPTAGNAVSNLSGVCAGNSFTLTLSGAALATGLTYQWQSSANGTSGWTDIAGATNNLLTTSQTASTFYRAMVTCSGVSVPSGSVQVMVIPGGFSGTYTINKNLPASATNFISVSAAASAVSCGVSGPVVFNVAPGSGPYNEQLILPAISGTSATNTITFEGNGNTLSAAPTGSMGIVTLKGTDYVRINNFTLALDPAALIGWGVQLVNEANFNTISNCTINLPLSSTSSDVNGIVTGNTTSEAGNHTNNSKFLNNTINGGYYPIRLNGNTGGINALNNEITGNIINDSYIYNIYLNNTDGTLVENNNISRPTRTTVSTFYGIYLAGVNQNVVISKNRIHTTHGAASSLTGSAYGIYSSSSDAPTGAENIVKNNVMYNFGSTGIMHGIHNAGSDGHYYYHNTIDLSSANNTGVVRGFNQTTAATNIRFINNIVTINSGATGSKHALFFNTTTSTITSNNNVLYVDPAAANHAIGSFGTASQATLANWKAVNGNAYDQNSISSDPVYANPATGNLTPTSVSVNAAGQPLAAVTTDINGAPRSATMPDPGAFEFTVSAINVGVTALTGPSTTGCGLSGQENITVTVKNFGSSPQSNIPVLYSVNGVNAAGTPEIIPGPVAPNSTATLTFATKANLSVSGSYNIQAKTTLPNDSDPSNDTLSLKVTNSLISGLPMTFDFETPATGLNRFTTTVNSRSAVSENVGASNGGNSTKGLIMEGGINPNWVLPTGQIDPWTSNPDHLAAISICVDPSGGNPNDSLWLSFDLKQLFKIANPNTNFRVMIDTQQVGPTHRPPFTGTPIVWQRIRVDLTPYKNQSSIRIRLESSVAEPYANGSGTANLIDNIQLMRVTPTGPVGVKENLLQSQLSVFPNPSAGIFNVSLAQGKAFEAEVTDLTGRVILKQAAKTNATQLNLSQAAKGVYLLKVSSEGAIAVKKIILE